mmetsp:Transcript_113507/g.244365  ORF Transcript_113507/g.244365 Transcript_113507/m.244365 type:complete len:275 (+) Transcript_113507:771-1595(+)
MRCTPLASASCTGELSPPATGSPQATTVPPSVTAAKASSVEYRATTSCPESFCWTPLLSPPEEHSPQVTTVPSCFSAAKARRQGQTWTTPPVSWLRTALLSPPERGSPQVTTEPSVFRAANARQLAKMSRTPSESCSCTGVLSPPCPVPPHVRTEPVRLRAANACFVAKTRGGVATKAPRQSPSFRLSSCTRAQVSRTVPTGQIRPWSGLPKSLPAWYCSWKIVLSDTTSSLSSSRRPLGRAMDSRSGLAQPIATMVALPRRRRGAHTQPGSLT